MTKLRIGQIDSSDIATSDFASRSSVDAVQGNLTAFSANATVSNAWVNANDYTTYLAAQSNDYSTLLEARSNDYSTLLEARANDYSTFTTLTANIYNTYTSLNANVGSGNTNIYVGDTLVSNTALILSLIHI